MIYDTSNKKELDAFKYRSNFLVNNNKVIDLKEVKKTRSNKQNASLHLFFTMISEQLNELGMEYTYKGLKGLNISLMYTDELVKMFFWKPIQLALFETKSTTKLDSRQMNQIIDIIINFFAEKGVVLEFPHIED